MVSDFLIPGGRLAVPVTISDAEPAAQLLAWRYATEHFIYGNDKYRLGDMADHTVKVTIFSAAFPSCQAVFLFDNASKHPPHAANVIQVGNMNLHPGGKQGVLRKGLMHAKDYHSQRHFL